MRGRLHAGLMALLLVWGAPNGWALTASQQRGQQLFTTGISANGTAVTALVGSAGVALPGGALPCANCHGVDARGRPEGGVIPSDIRWLQLTKEYGVRSSSGRRYPAYTDASFADALRLGVDPAATPLNSAMPRYRLSDSDLADLRAYLMVVDEILDPGVSDGQIRLATLVPAPEQAGLGQDIVRVLRAYFADVNAAGGVYGRQLELVVQAEPADGPAPAVWAAERLLAQQPFALVSPVALQAPLQLAAWAERQRLPVMGPFASRSGAPGELSRFSFYLLGDAGVRLRALLQAAMISARLHGGEALLLAQRQALDALDLSELDFLGLDLRVEIYADTPQLQQLLAQPETLGATDLVHFGAAEQLRLLLQAATRQQRTPTLYIAASGGLGDRLRAAQGYAGELYVGYPMLSSDLQRAAWQAFEQFRVRHQLTEGPLQPQLHAYVAAQLTTHALKAVGKKLSRERLIHELEQLYNYQTGLMPPFSYSPNRRIGAYGAHVVSTDLTTGRPNLPGRWVEPLTQY